MLIQSKIINGRTVNALLLIGLSLFINDAMAAKINVTFDRNPVNLDETFQIIFSADEVPDGEPDFGPLEEDFEILSQSNSNNVTLINGKMSRSVRWTLNAMAKHTGTLEVPPVNFGSEISATATLQVNESSGSNGLNGADDIFVDVEATPENPYVQAQVLYTVRIYTRVEIARATIDEPELADAVIEKLGDDKSFNTRVKGVDYTVTERKYAIFPQKSGTMTIEPLTLNAEVTANSRSSFNGFFNPNVTRAKRVRSKAVTLTVKPAPASFTGNNWLAAAQLDLEEEWSGDLNKLKVGEPVTRTLKLRAKGTTVGQLPELGTEITNETLKFYPDQPVLQELKDGDSILAQRQEKIALIPSKGGSFKLPAIEIPWFNTRTERVEVAKIPGTTIHVMESGSAKSEETGKPLVSGTENKRPSFIVQNQAKSKKNIWVWISGALALGWLATLIIVFIRWRRPAERSDSPESLKEPDVGECRQQLKKACADNHPSAAKDALLAWGRLKYNANSLGEIAVFCEARLRDEILILNRALYSNKAETWEGKRLLQAFAENKAAERWKSENDDTLEPLFRL